MRPSSKGAARRRAAGGACWALHCLLGTAAGACAKDQPPAGFARIGKGHFVMGNPVGGEDGMGNDSPHDVTITRDFFLQRREVTRAEFRALMGAVPAAWSPHGDDVPVAQVNWYEAIAFANARSRSEGLAECYRVTGAEGMVGAGCRAGQFGCGPGPMWPEWERDGYAAETVEWLGLDCEGYRLPTEAEWEYAASAGLPREQVAAHVDALAWHDGNADAAMPAGTTTANDWGLHDMLGNVWEMCWDVESELGPAAAIDPTGPPSGESRVNKGGSYVNGAAEIYPARRLAGGPIGRDANVGFRLARTAR